MGRGRLGFGDGLGGKELPFYENFYAGGSGTVRGFRSNTIGPKAVYYDGASDKLRSDSPSRDAIGGNAMAVASMELITPTPFIDENTRILSAHHSLWMPVQCGIPIGTILSLCRSMVFLITVKQGTSVFLLVLRSSGFLRSDHWSSYAKPIKDYQGDRTEQFQFNIGKTR